MACPRPPRVRAPAVGTGRQRGSRSRGTRLAVAPCADGGRCSWTSAGSDGAARPPWRLGRKAGEANALSKEQGPLCWKRRFSARARKLAREVGERRRVPPSLFPRHLLLLLVAPYLWCDRARAAGGRARASSAGAYGKEPATSAWQRSTVALSSRRRPPPGAARERPRGPDRARSRLRAGWSSLHCPSRASERVTAWPEARRGNRPMMASASSACCISASASSSWVEAADHHCGRTPRWPGGRRAVTGRRRRAGACPRLAGAQ